MTGEELIKLKHAGAEVVLEIEKKKKELEGARATLVRMKADIDNDMQRLKYLRLRVQKLHNDGRIPEEVKALITEALNGY